MKVSGQYECSVTFQMSINKFTQNQKLGLALLKLLEERTYGERSGPLVVIYGCSISDWPLHGCVQCIGWQAYLGLMLEVELYVYIWHWAWCV